ncbi:MAG: hypothetical protein L6367_16215 [Cellulomonas sp.]|nr:hypothetical protein [Cellulomonas sp.]
MPLFEVGDGRARVVQPARPGADSFATEVAAILAQHLDVVLGEPVLVVHLRSGGPRTELPDVVAIDVHRSPVVVDVVPVLDESALMATLQRAGGVARLSRRDVAHLFHPQTPDRFDAAVREFLESVSLSACEPSRPGMRVVLLCEQIAPEAVDTLAFWRARGRLDVVLVGAVLGEDGRRLLTVETLADLGALASAATRGAVAHVNGAVRTGSNGAIPIDVTQSLPIVTARDLDALHAVIGFEADERSGHEPDERSVSPRFANPVLVAPRGASAVVAGGSASATAPTPARGGPTAAHSSATGKVSRSNPPVLLPPPPGPGQHRPSEPVRPSGAGLLPGPPWSTDREHSVSALRARETPGEPPTTRPYVIVPPPPPPPVRPAPDGPPQHPATPRPADPRAASRPADPTPAVVRGTGDRVPTELPEPHPQLRTLAEATSAPAALVWHRRRRGQRLAAWLRADGLLALSSGELFADPSRAAAVAAGIDGEVDGWRAWRFGEAGPTLEEAVALVEG